MPYFIFDRTRNTMLAIMLPTMLPGVLACVFLQMRGTYLKKAAVLLGCFFVVNFWFNAVMANRQGMSFDLQGALSCRTGNEQGEEARHEGLNMLEDLAWIDLLALLKSYGTASGRLKVIGAFNTAWLPGFAPAKT